MTRSMKLYLLECKDGIGNGYDETDAVLVRAPSEAEARTLASRAAWQDRRVKGSAIRDFLDPSRTTCEEVPQAGTAGVLLQSNRPG